MNKTKAILAGVIIGGTIAFAIAGVISQFEQEPERVTILLLIQMAAAQLLVLFKVNNR